ncbi:MAG TPA: RagB/SusD family nutrient uptake outer membrane protein [Chitinophaga sp.]|uniref:RagB/SusD family nutrient uptake outer membrane protein n=1 Tax=Chitinophaga sp. TaxID=1869181 RepID=UPI002B64185E|nr:RagB/SusD family nutrient uptake outer membrane protein [Chitinophaga sp.]HVI44851.1 RagB/SusD family nutrient uptake outer membrane protein [Chitinophaga sp.]
MRIFKIILTAFFIICGIACNKFLDIIPDNVATLEQAFQLRATAKKYLFTCYSYLPRLGSVSENYTFLGSREIATPYPGSQAPGIPNGIMELCYDYQNVVTPIANYWDGLNGGKPMFEAIRTCNIFLENIGKVPDITEAERKRWIAEVKVLKAYYHFLLVRMYGPVPILRKNLPVASDVEAVKVKREPVDDAVAYIAQLTDEALNDLPLTIMNQREELGRITQPVALAVKAYALVLGASPLFNGNSDYTALKNKDGQALVNTNYDQAKWQKAAEACNQAITVAAQAGFKLYYFEPPFDLKSIGDTTRKCLDIRCALTEEWNQENIWTFPHSNTGELQRECAPRNDVYSYTYSLWAANLKACEIFYTKNGVPIEEDMTWDYANRYAKLRTIPDSLRSILKPNYTTSSFNMDREYRFYADLAFDGSSFFMKQRPAEDNLLYINTMWGSSSANSLSRYSFTGYWPKKLVSWKTSGDGGSYTADAYVWPAIRLSGLYLMYAEALNESEGPSGKAIQYVDEVRRRAGLNGVVQSWAAYSRNANKPSSREGLRSIIQQETMIEFMFEGENYWNMRRWKRLDLMNRPVTGWDVSQSTPATFYRLKTIYQPHNTYRDYLTPIREYDLFVNPNLVQNPLW